MSGYRVLPAAYDDLLDLVEHASDYSERARDALTDTLIECFERLSAFPNLGRARSDLDPRVRSFPVNRLRVTVYYFAPGEDVGELLIARVLRQGRDVSGEDVRPEL
ncbi:type II toxin-antitoxin system RelE/ParE family toxin [Rubrivirga sp.]|uniref:type II toxin-antitoxin system RelE/ParE family toxin n=1 Tax=Rubrivirga sp. TaxID=1885344 RepID=UPI003B51C177